LVEEGRVGAFYWYDGTVGYALVGPADRDRLLHLARIVYDQLDAPSGS
jgi:anti-sigma factor RsiW